MTQAEKIIMGRRRREMDERKSTARRGAESLTESAKHDNVTARENVILVTKLILYARKKVLLIFFF